LDLWDGGLVKNHKPKKRENNDIYIPINSMYKIKELYNKSRDTFIGKKCITAFILNESGEENPCLDIARSLPMELFLNTHNFSPMLLMKSIHNLTWRTKTKLSQVKSTIEFFMHKPT
jgi:hypothetical protein